MPSRIAAGALPSDTAKGIVAHATIADGCGGRPSADLDDFLAPGLFPVLVQVAYSDPRPGKFEHGEAEEGPILVAFAAVALLDPLHGRPALPDSRCGHPVYGHAAVAET